MKTTASPALARILLAAALTLAAALPALAQEESTGRNAADRPAPDETRVYKEIEGLALEIWIWKPAGWKPEDRRPGMVFFHGGGWRNGNPSAFSRQSRVLADRGMVACSVRYRLLSGPGETMEKCVSDARSAFRWVRAHAAELGLDPERIAAGGGSAGGHLAASLAAIPGFDDPGDDLAIPVRPAALALFNPAVHLESERIERLVPGGLRRLSPYHQLEETAGGHPPTLILQGDEDTTTPLRLARLYAERVEAAGGACEIEVYEGQAHGFFNRSPYLEATLERTIHFLEALGLLEPEENAG